jgi:hypothetical protein
VNVFYSRNAWAWNLFRGVLLLLPRLVDGKGTHEFLLVSTSELTPEN